MITKYGPTVVVFLGICAAGLIGYIGGRAHVDKQLYDIGYAAGVAEALNLHFSNGEYEIRHKERKDK